MCCLHSNVYIIHLSSSTCSKWAQENYLIVSCRSVWVQLLTFGGTEQCAGLGVVPNKWRSIRRNGLAGGMGEERGEEPYKETDKTIRDKQDSVRSRMSERERGSSSFSTYSHLAVQAQAAWCSRAPQSRVLPWADSCMLSALELLPRERKEPLGMMGPVLPGNPFVWLPFRTKFDSWGIYAISLISNMSLIACTLENCMFHCPFLLCVGVWNGHTLSILVFCICKLEESHAWKDRYMGAVISFWWWLCVSTSTVNWYSQCL